MTFEEQLSRLEEMSEDKIKIVNFRLKAAIEARVKGKFIYGAHSEEVLGDYYTSYYINAAWDKLLSKEWTWKEDKSLLEQLKIIAENLIGKQVEKYERHAAQRARGARASIKLFDPTDFLVNNLNHEDKDDEDDQIYQARLDAIQQAISDDDELVEFFNLVQKGATYDDILLLSGWSDGGKKRLYRLKETFTRKVRTYVKRNPNPLTRIRQNSQ